MLPGGMDPRKMEAMMRQMGIKSQDISAKKVIIETDSGNIVIESPQVVQITMQGQKSFQISGNVREESSSEDIKMVMEQANVTEEEAKQALKDAQGDIAEAILKLSEEKE
ncbi:MAG: nascent polypeptide-associated complex protein [Candidatus Bilamarchaeum sp.]|jgi:nascent polypeptide-associated complex subunit alpha